MASKNKQLTTILIVIFILSGTFYFGFQYGAGTRPAIDTASELINKDNDKVSEKIDFAAFWKVWSLIDEKFVPTQSTTTVSSQDKVWGAIQGLTASLGDPFTTFFPPEENKIFETEISGKFEGVGMEIGNKDGALVVISPLKDTPAYRSGIEPGDVILKINDAASINMNSDQAVKLIRGPKGTVVKLLLGRSSKKEPFEIKITRDTINIPTIDTESKQISSTTGEKEENGLTKEGVFIIRLYNFSEPSPNLFRNALRQFILTGSEKLILDLRGNPGGYLSASIDMASWFLPAGKVIVRENYGDKKSEDSHRSIGYNVFSNGNLKMIILVNGGSASASEILAGALQEYGIAKLVGTKTFGKGSVQELVSITPETSLKVTIAKWLTPNGISISDGGLTPDYIVELTDKDKIAKKDPQLDKALELLKKL